MKDQPFLHCLDNSFLSDVFLSVQTGNPVKPLQHLLETMYHLFIIVCYYSTYIIFNEVSINQVLVC